MYYVEKKIEIVNAASREVTNKYSDGNKSFLGEISLYPLNTLILTHKINFFCERKEVRLLYIGATGFRSHTFPTNPALCLLCLYYALLCLLCLYHAYTMSTMPTILVPCLYYAYYSVLCPLCLYYSTMSALCSYYACSVYYLCAMPTMTELCLLCLHYACTCVLCLFITTDILLLNKKLLQSKMGQTFLQNVSQNCLWSCQPSCIT